MNNFINILSKVFSLVLPSTDKENLLGTYEELYHEIKDDKGAAIAILWYIGQIVITVPIFIKDSIIWGNTMLKNYLKISLRSVLRNKVYSSINILGFSLGIACSLVIGIYVNYEMNYDNFHTEKDNTYRILIKAVRPFAGKEYSRWMPGLFAKTIKESLPEVKYAANVDFDNGRVQAGQQVFQEDLFYSAGEDFLKMYSLEAVYGDLNNSLQEPFTVIISESRARKYFGMSDPVGKVLRFNDEYDYTVTAVYKDLPENSHIQFDFLASYSSRFQTPEAASLNNWLITDPGVYLVVNPETNIEELEKKLAKLLKEKKGTEKEREILLEPITNIHTSSLVPFEFQPPADLTNLKIFLYVALFIMVIACFNYINLSTARSSLREKEIGVRKVIGADRKKLIYQFMTESLMLTTISVILSIFLLKFFLPYFNSAIDKNLIFEVFDFSNLLLLLSIIVGISLLAGIYPAFVLSSFNPINILNKIHSGGKKFNTLMRNILVVVQFSITIFLISSTLIINQQRSYISDKNLGYDKENIINVKFNLDRSIKIDELMLELKKNSHVLDVTASVALPNEWNMTGPVNFEGKPENFDTRVSRVFVGYNFVDFYNIKILQGRNFSKQVFSDANEGYLINETAAKVFNWTDPIGKKIENGRVIGVIKDYHFKTLHQPISPLVLELNNFSTREHISDQYISVKFEMNKIEEALQFVEKKCKEFAPAHPFNFTFFDETLEAQYKNEKQIGELFNYFSALAITIACLGLFGLTVFIVERKIKEIGIRKVLGASIPTIMFLISQKFLFSIVISNIIAIPVSYLLMQAWLENFAYKINVGFEEYLLAALIALVIAFLTIIGILYKAGRQNPINALRYE